MNADSAGRRQWLSRFAQVVFRLRHIVAATGEDVTTLGHNKATAVDRNKLIRRLRELIEALERRVPHLEREGEIGIAREAATLKQKALERIGELER